MLTAGFQGCRENSVCYPPSEQTMALVLPATSEVSADVAGSTSAAPTEQVSEQDRYAQRIVNGSWWTMLGVFFVAGLALSLTPCVLPMVPILSSIIAGQGGTVSTSRGFFLSLSYVLGMAATYTVAGALAALAGGQIQAMFQKPWIITCSRVYSSCSRSGCSVCSSFRCRLRSKPGSRGSRTANAAARSSASP